MTSPRIFFNLSLTVTDLVSPASFPTEIGDRKESKGPDSPIGRFSSKPKPVSASDESALVQRARRGDDEAFASLAGLYRGRIATMAGRFARGAHEIDDLVQEIFIRVWKGLDRFREDAPFEHWIMRVAVRACYDFLRRHRRRRESEVLVDEMPPISDAMGPDSGDGERQRREAWEIVQVLLENLGEKDRLAVTLIDLEQKSVKEAAALTGWSESNVKVRAFRARQRMKELYRERFSTYDSKPT